MLIALFALLFAGGGDHSFLLGRIDLLLDNVKAVVQSDERRTHAVKILKDMEQDTEDFVDRQKSRAKDLEDLNETPDLDTAAADAVWDAMFKDLESYHARALSRRQELKSVVNRDEWARVFATSTTD